MLGVTSVWGNPENGPIFVLSVSIETFTYTFKIYSNDARPSVPGSLTGQMRVHLVPRPR